MNIFSLKNKICIITGGAGLLGIKHAEAIIEAGGTPVLLDISKDTLEHAQKILHQQFNAAVPIYKCDITQASDITKALEQVVSIYGRLDILINNAAINPKFEGDQQQFSRLENFSLDQWNKELQVGLTGAFLCSQLIGAYMAQHGKGVIINVSSDLGIIAPNQNLYKKEGLSSHMQPVKPVTYSVIKHGLIGLTKYIATYWAEAGIRCNAIAPGGVFTNQEQNFVQKLAELIPMGRMATQDEYKGAIIFLASDASSYMTGTVLSIDGGRTCW